MSKPILKISILKNIKHLLRTLHGTHILFQCILLCFDILLLAHSISNLNRDVLSLNDRNIPLSDCNVLTPDNRDILSPNDRDVLAPLSHSHKRLVFDTEYEAAAYVAERLQLLKIANEMASYNGLDASDKENRSVVLSQQVRCLLLYSKTQYKTHKMSLGINDVSNIFKMFVF